MFIKLREVRVIYYRSIEILRRVANILETYKKYTCARINYKQVKTNI